MIDNCCSPGGELIRPEPSRCPTNQQRGRYVSQLTLKAMLAVPLTGVSEADYFFCRATNCPIVYFRADGQQIFEVSQLRERVYQKCPDSDSVFVCYCFRHTVGSVRAELRQTGMSTVFEQITAGIQTGQCACDIRNPQGECCLGNVRRLVQRFKSDDKERLCA